MKEADPDARFASPTGANSRALPSVALVGVGAMGMPIALRLHNHGFDICAVDISTARIEQCREAGLSASTDLGAIAGRDVVIAMVATGTQLLDLLAAPVFTDGRLEGAVLIAMSTVGPDVVRDAAVSASQLGIGLIDCPVTGGVIGATDGTLTLIVSGDQGAVDSARPVLDVAGAVRVVGSRPGDGQSLKLVNQMLAGIHLVAAGEAIAFAERLGLDLDVVTDLLPTGAAASWMFADRGPRMALPTEQRPTQTHLSVFVKDSGLVSAAAAASGAYAPLTAAARDALTRAAELGLGDGDDSGIVEVFRTY
ncbi:NAD(P)-dependent oxidoreductase [Tsukamurella soli]|uniref:NAD(P)-dependent oxidoreductase n=1 Tax=Tsukamurella soli TaxID=644556 RepID=A0ABP8JIK0_9ACTN